MVCFNDPVVHFILQRNGTINIGFLRLVLVVLLVLQGIGTNNIYCTGPVWLVPVVVLLVLKKHRYNKCSMYRTRTAGSSGTVGTTRVGAQTMTKGRLVSTASFSWPSFYRNSLFSIN